MPGKTKKIGLDGVVTGRIDENALDIYPIGGKLFIKGTYPSRTSDVSLPPTLAESPSIAGSPLSDEAKAAMMAKEKERKALVTTAYDDNKNVPFIQRIINRDDKYIKTGDNQVSTHLMSYARGDDGYYVYPLIMQDEQGNLRDYGDNAYNVAREKGDFIRFDTEEEAAYFSEHYKENPSWKPYLDNIEEKSVVDDFYRAYSGIMEADKKNVSGAKSFNDMITMGEYLNNKNEPLTTGIPLNDNTREIRAAKVDTTAYNDATNMALNATMKRLRDSGLSHLIPSVQASYAKSVNEFAANAANQNAQFQQQADTQNAQLSEGRYSFNKQMEMQNLARYLEEKTRQGEALSKNMETFRTSDALKRQGDSAIADNEQRLDLIKIIQKYPEYEKALIYLLGKNNVQQQKKDVQPQV